MEDSLNVTQENLYRAWVAAVEAVGTEEGDPQALTSREICEHILGWPLTEHFIRKTRARIREWIKAGIIEATQKRETTIRRHGATVPAYRLVDSEDFQV